MANLGARSLQALDCSGRKEPLEGPQFGPGPPPMGAPRLIVSLIGLGRPSRLFRFSIFIRSGPSGRHWQAAGSI